MNPAECAGSRVVTQAGRPLPAYGPIDTLPGFVLSYVVVDRATPVVVDDLDAALPGVRWSTVGLGLAAVLWFVLTGTVVDQVRRQLAALGEGGADGVRRESGRPPRHPERPRPRTSWCCSPAARSWR